VTGRQERRPILTLADRLLATILHQRLALPQVIHQDNEQEDLLLPVPGL
jgi:hypothetical protein